MRNWSLRSRKTWSKYFGKLGHFIKTLSSKLKKPWKKWNKHLFYILGINYRKCVGHLTTNHLLPRLSPGISCTLPCLSPGITISNSLSTPQGLVSRWCPWHLVSLLCGLVCLLTSVGAVTAWCLLPAPPDRYLVLLDAGSVHTSVYTYR